jgi:hypothetical protein
MYDGIGVHGRGSCYGGCAADQAAQPQAIQKGRDERTGEYNADPSKLIGPPLVIED